MWEATCEIEQNLAYHRMLSSAQKSKTSTTNLRNSLKTLLDGPNPDEFAPMRNGTTYVSTPLAVQVQATYRDLFGTAKNHRKTTLPKRIVKDRTKKKGLAAFHRHRGTQVGEVQTSASSDIKQLQAETVTTARSTRSPRMTTLSQALEATLVPNSECFSWSMWLLKYNAVYRCSSHDAHTRAQCYLGQEAEVCRSRWWRGERVAPEVRVVSEGS
jgi:hypothetical protein